MQVEQFIRSFPAPLVSTFRTWLHAGWVPQDRAMGAPGTIPPKYGTMGEFVAAHCAFTGGEERSLVRDFFGFGTTRPSVAQAARISALQAQLRHMSGWLLNLTLDQMSTDAQEADRLGRIGRDSLLRHGLNEFALRLLAVVEGEVGHLTLLDLFRRRRHTVGLASWSPYNTNLLAQAERTDDTPLGGLYLYCETDGDDEAVVGFEWAAGVRADGEDQWLAVAAGMVYTFEDAEDGSLALQLLDSADNVSSGDRERAEAFIQAYRNAERILAKGDIAFLWQWERRHGTAAGLGMEFLAEVCEALRADFPQLRSLVIPLSCERFQPRAANEPSVVAEARLTEVDKLQTYVSSLGARLGLEVYITGSDQHDISRGPEIL